MTKVTDLKIWRTIPITVFITLFVFYPVRAQSQDGKPIADAGLSRYAGPDPIVLDGTGSYDPDNSDSLTYEWRQIAGPNVIVVDANTATPSIGGALQPGTGRDLTPKIVGFTQTDAIQVCEFELVVSDGELTSIPDTVAVIIVPDFGASTLRLENPPFSRNKPTIIYFGGGDCIVGGGAWSNGDWAAKANVISFPGYSPDSSDEPRTYYRYGDMIIVYLSSVASDYKQPIQTTGWSTGGQPAIDVGIHLNLTYADSRYAINRVTFYDATSYCRNYYSESISTFLASSVNGEQCWIDNYVTTVTGQPGFHLNVLNVGSEISDHSLAPNWYKASLIGSDMNKFNNGVVAGAYWSVIGPGKNLQLASTPEKQTYKFKWYGSASSGYMDFYDKSLYPGKLPEPVKLMAWRDSSDPNGVVFTCKESENAVEYELLFGHDPYRVIDYNIVSDTPIPPDEVITNFPLEETWWTIRARDQYGSTIYADPMHVDLENLPWPTIENLTTGQTYGYIQAAIDHAAPGDEIVISPRTYHENITVEGENLTVTSTNPTDPTIVTATIIDGIDQDPVVHFTRGQNAGCVLAGLTINGGTVGISCGDASPLIRNCTIESTGPVAIEFLYGHEPTIINCTVLGSIVEVYDPHLVALWKMDEIDGSIAYDSIGVNDGDCHGDPLWQPAGGMLAGALDFDGFDDYVNTPFIISPSDGSFSVFAWIKGGAAGQVVLSQTGGANWLSADPSEGNFTTELVPPTTRSPLPPLVSETVITDGNWHHIGFVRSGASRTLYVDSVMAAEDVQNNLATSINGLYIGAGKNLEAGTFFSGLIDDVRISNVALSAEKIATLTQ